MLSIYCAVLRLRQGKCHEYDANKIWVWQCGWLFVADIDQARTQLEAKGARVLGDGSVKTGAHGNPVLFLHPKDFNGTLIELEQIPEGGAH